MEIIQIGLAGSMESSDVLVRIEPKLLDGIELTIDSVVEKQFGEAIRTVILSTLEEMNVQRAIVSVMDRGALDCTLNARVKTAVCRASGEAYIWGGIQK